jgi:hypothetical protein
VFGNAPRGAVMNELREALGRRGPLAERLEVVQVAAPNLFLYII